MPTVYLEIRLLFKTGFYMRQALITRHYDKCRCPRNQKHFRMPYQVFKMLFKSLKCVLLPSINAVPVCSIVYCESCLVRGSKLTKRSSGKQQKNNDDIVQNGKKEQKYISTAVNRIRTCAGRAQLISSQSP